MFAVLFALFLAAADPSPPVDPSTWPADPTRAVIIRGNNWIRQPTEARLTEAWPAAARQAGVSGKVVMNCMVAYDGGLEDCRVLTETPAGMGFGAAALSLTGQYQLSPNVDGQSTTGGRMLVPVRFRPAP